jgi:acetyltransferase-like isoleucine patch superfamily enzyme
VKSPAPIPPDFTAEATGGHHPTLQHKPEAEGHRMKLPERLAPIVITAFKRPHHLKATLEALSRNELADRSELFIFCDGPKLFSTQQDLELIRQTRAIARMQNWCGQVTVIESESNNGLVRSFLKAINFGIQRAERVIVLEDDQETSIGFLKYMNEALETYKDDEQIMHISGYMYPADFDAESDTFFLNVQSCPGWATWARAWQHYRHDAGALCEEVRRHEGGVPYFDIGWTKWFSQLEKNVSSPGYSFAVRWYATCFLRKGLSLFPKRSLVRNIGIDGSGEHCQPSTMYDVVPVDYITVARQEIVENTSVRQAIGKHYEKYYRKPASGLRLRWRNLKGWLRAAFRRPLLQLLPEIRDANSVKTPRSAVSALSRVAQRGRLMDVEVGRYSYIAENARISHAKIGSFTSIGPDCCCGYGIHPIDQLSTAPMFYSTLKQNGSTLSMSNKVQERLPITIGNDVFIGMNVTVLDGVTIGDGAVVGAGCVVSKDVPPYAVVVGCPMRILRYRFSEETIAALLKIRWWDWPDERLKEVEEMFFDVEGFVSKYREDAAGGTVGGA